MWGTPPFWIADGCAVDVRNLAAARDWYKELGLREIHDRKEDDSGRPFADVGISKDSAVCSLVELESGAAPSKQACDFLHEETREGSTMVERPWRCDGGDHG